MLKEVLRVINDSGLVNLSDIADKVGTTESMVNQVITLLVLRGYLEEVVNNQNCETYCCSSCSSHCPTRQQIKSCYIVTEKGKKYFQIS